MTTLDCIYQVDQPPSANEKVAANKSLLVAGGPATNAAVAFAQLGQSRHHQATLLSAVGQHPLTALLKEDLQTHGVTLMDLTSHRLLPPPVSSIVVTAATGDRAIVATNTSALQATPNPDFLKVLEAINIVLIDGHQMAVSAQIAQQAKAQQIPVVIDAGSWKPGFESVLALADVVIASANFFPPDCADAADVFDYVQHLKVPLIAITHGAEPILYRNGNSSGVIEIPNVRAVDTLGAGDIFHGAFCHFYLTHGFEESLLKASRSAAFACQHWGTRDWSKIYCMTTDDDDEETDKSCLANG